LVINNYLLSFLIQS